MMNDRKTLTQLSAALLIGLLGVVGTLLLLSQGASAQPMLQEEADLGITKTGDPDPVVAGETLTYTLVVANSGPVTATNTVVTDTLPSGVSFDAADPSQGTYNSVTGVWTVGEVADGGSATLTLVLTVDPSRRGSLSNSAEVSADETDLAPENNTYLETTVVDAEADLVITKTDSPDPVVAGETLTYTLTVTNSGPSDATGVDVVDTLPSGVSFYSATPSQGWYNSVTGSWTVGSVPDGGSATLTLVVTVDPSTRGTLSNTADVSGDETDPTPGDNTATAGTTVDAEADLALAKTDDPDPVVAGNPLTYTLTVTNGGPSDGTNVVVTDTLPSGVSFDAATPSQGTFNDVTGVWDVGSVPDEGSATLTLLVTVDPSTRGTLSNSAEVSGDETDPTPGDNAAGQGTAVNAETDLVVTKTDDPDPVVAGAALTYTVTVTNSGPSDGTGIALVDDLPDDVTLFSATPSQGACVGVDPLTCNIGALASGAKASVSLVVSVTSPLANGTILTNVVTVSGDQTDPDAGNNSVEAQTIVQSSPVLTITKGDNPDPVNAGGTLLYTLVITNSGNENATGVTVTEHYDPNVSFFYAYPSPDSGTDDRWTLGTVTVGDPKRIDVIVEVTGTLPVGTVLTNEATLDSDQTAPLTVTEVTSTTSSSELTITKVDFPDPVQAGGTLGYVITYQNSGTAPAEEVIITDTYDSRVTYTSANPAPRGGTDNVWDIGYLPVGDVGSITVTVGVTTPLANGTILTNLVTMDSKYTPPLSDTETTRVSSAPELTFSVVDHPDPVDAGDPLTYTLRYTNAGNADATGVVVTATLDADVSFSGAVPPPDDGSGRVRVWNLGTIPGEGGAGEILVYASVPISLPDGTVLVFAAQLEDAEGDLLERTAQTDVRTLPDLTIETVGAGHEPALFSPGKQMAYTMTYGNTAYEDAQDVVITTTLPPGTSYKDTRYHWQSAGDGVYTYWVGPLLARSTGHVISFTVEHPDTPQVNAPEFTTPFTIAPRGGLDGDANSADNTISVTIGVPDLIVTDFTVEPWPLQPDVPVIFTVTLKNQGTGPALNPENMSGSALDVFTGYVVSWPFDRYSEKDIWDYHPVLDPGEEHTMLLTLTRHPDGTPKGPITFTQQEIDEIQAFYVKADNFGENDYGLIPESNEMNNVFPRVRYLYLPMVLKD
jgi:uncharacterized repeat protein (TIGR01451 family)